MGRSPCCDKDGLKKGPWTPEEDKILVDYIQANGHGSWRSLPKHAGLQRCGKSCRLRWTNYLRPDIKRGPFTPEEQKSIIQLHGIVGNKWSTIAAQLPGRTDNEIKNYWNTHLKKRLIHLGINPDTYAPASPLSLPPPSNSSPNSSSSSPAINHPHLGPTSSFSAARHMAQWESARLEAEARLSRQSLLFSSSSSSSVSPPSSFPAHHYNTESEAKIVVEKQQDAPDVILRIWNSEIGEAFRKPVAVAAAASKGGDNEVSETDQERVVLAKGEAASSSSAVTVSEVGHAGVSERKEEVDDESISKAEEVMDETYDQFYMDLAGGEDELSLFQAQMGTSSCFSLFTCDLDEASLDNPFK